MPYACCQYYVYLRNASFPVERQVRPVDCQHGVPRLSVFLLRRPADPVLKVAPALPRPARPSTPSRPSRELRRATAPRWQENPQTGAPSCPCAYKARWRLQLGRDSFQWQARRFRPRKSDVPHRVEPAPPAVLGQGCAPAADGSEAPPQGSSQPQQSSRPVRISPMIVAVIVVLGCSPSLPGRILQSFIYPSARDTARRTDSSTVRQHCHLSRCSSTVATAANPEIDSSLSMTRDRPYLDIRGSTQRASHISPGQALAPRAAGRRADQGAPSPLAARVLHARTSPTAGHFPPGCGAPPPHACASSCVRKSRSRASTGVGLQASHGRLCGCRSVREGPVGYAAHWGSYRHPSGTCGIVRIAVASTSVVNSGRRPQPPAFHCCTGWLPPPGCATPRRHVRPLPSPHERPAAVSASGRPPDIARQAVRLLFASWTPCSIRRALRPSHTAAQALALSAPSSPDPKRSQAHGGRS
ncbi:hypothetical protein PsYK624_012970 [Phanerochaete sordida]|uniref:Uncharacterized protein n=1 Tax=Phanerochaete sordida TaxID=48140 RepID=A0A9P3FZZ6_9APHY|nr:hypothetical protein PsYK624_012970 [Phanerochaete sordida]